MYRWLSAMVLATSMIAFGVSTAEAGWALQQEGSSISFVSTKTTSGGEFAEVHKFQRFSGLIDDSGSIRLKIDLASVETLIDIRNQRMKEFLFEVIDFPEIQIQADADFDRTQKLAIGEQEAFSLSLQVAMHDVTSFQDAEIMLTRLAKDRVLVTSIEPVIVDARMFELGAGIEILRELASLNAISMIVPVTFNLIFVQE